MQINLKFSNVSNAVLVYRGGHLTFGQIWTSRVHTEAGIAISALA